MGLFRPTKTSSANTPQPVSHVHSCPFFIISIIIIIFNQSSCSKQSRVSIFDLGFRRRRADCFRSGEVVKLLLNDKHMNMLTEITWKCNIPAGGFSTFPSSVVPQCKHHNLPPVKYGKQHFPSLYSVRHLKKAP